MSTGIQMLCERVKIQSRAIFSSYVQWKKLKPYSKVLIESVVRFFAGSKGGRSSHSYEVKRTTAGTAWVWAPLMCGAGQTMP